MIGIEWIAIGGVALMLIAWLARAWGESEQTAEQRQDVLNAIEQAKRARDEIDEQERQRITDKYRRD